VRPLDLRPLDLRPLDFRELDLRELDLRPLDFREADLRELDLRPLDFREADLREPDLRPLDFREADLRELDLRPLDLRPLDLRDDVDFFADFRDDDFLFGTLPPARRASDNPMAIACLRLFTFLPELPLLSVPCLRSCIAFLTLDCAFLPYFAMVEALLTGFAPTARAALSDENH
jgi:uncharacterized protein YjbI with pentapeptide repeats